MYRNRNGQGKRVQETHGSFASQSSPTGIAGFEPLRDVAVGDVVGSDEPGTDSLGAFAIRNA